MKNISLFVALILGLFPIVSCNNTKIPSGWTKAMNNTKGQYACTAIRPVDESIALDLDGDGVAHNDLRLEIQGLELHDYALNGTSDVYSLEYHFDQGKSGSIKLWIPSQWIHLPLVSATGFYADLKYNIDDNYNITVEDIADFDSDEENRPEYSANNGHLTFVKPGLMEFEINCSLYDFQTKQIDQYRLVYTFKRIRIPEGH